MTPEQFCYWLQGRAELKPDEVPTPEEWAMIREHLATVFHKVTPELGGTPKYPNMYPPTRSPSDASDWIPPLRAECKVTDTLLLC